jgi:GAF domain-containing protein
VFFKKPTIFLAAGRMKFYLKGVDGVVGFVTMENSFNRPIIPLNEPLRLKALEYLNILNDIPDQYFTNLARIVATAFNTPIALVSLVGEEEVFFKGNFGMEHTTRAGRGVSLCSLAILAPDPTVFRDALKEPCLLSNPLVAGAFGLRFYAGAPIITNEGLALGAVCIVAKEPRDFSHEEERLLSLFAQNALQEIKQRGRVAY